MTKKFYLTALVFIMLAQACIAERINHTDHRIMLNETTIWIEDVNWAIVTDGGRPIYLYLDETNPVFFALIYNTLKDHVINKGNICDIFTIFVDSPVHGDYSKIKQIHIQ